MTATLAAGENLVGREAELARIEAFLAAVPIGARALVIRGEPGIGKTTLWRRAVADARSAGFRVLLARPAEEEMSFTLGGLGDLFEDVEPEGSPLRMEDDVLARGRLVLETVRALAGAAPLLLAIDDLQWLDAASARALRFALRRLDAEPVGVLATLRVGAAAADPLAAAATLPPGRQETLDVGPLSLGALRRMLGTAVTAISRPTLHRINDVSGGNPLFALELARQLGGDPDALRSGAGLRLPDSLQQAIAGRLERLPAELAPLLETVSALGRAEVRELRAALPGEDTEALLASAQEQGLLVVGEDLEVRFSHPLLGSVVYGGMSPLARRRIHARLAGLASDADVRARHLALSTDEPDAGVARQLEEAAERAGARGALDLAAELAHHSLRLTAPAEDPEAARRRALAQIEHQAEAGEVSTALALADTLLETLPPGRGRAEALAQRAQLEDRDRKASEAFLEQALAEAGDDERLRARLLNELVDLRGLFLGDPAGAIACGEAAVEIAERLEDDALWVAAVGHLGYVEGLAGKPDTSRMEEAAALEERTGSPALGEGSRVVLGKRLLWDGELAASRALFEAAYADDVRLGRERQRAYRLYDLALAEIAAGEFRAAEAHVLRGAEAAGDAEDSFAERLLLIPRGLVDAWLGRAENARASADRLLAGALERASLPGQILARKIRGLLALSEGETESSARELAEAAALQDTLGIRHPGAFPLLPEAVEALSSAGDLATADVLAERLDEQAAALGSAWPRAAAGRARGVVLLAEGAADEAAAALAEAGEAFDRLGYRPDAARARLLFGRALLRAGRRTAAADAIADARDRFAALGARLWEARAAEELERAAPGRAAGELTPTESRIAELVASGRKNREIAQALFVSVATVEAHLTRIYRKLGIRSRSELTRLVSDGTLALPVSGPAGDV